MRHEREAGEAGERARAMEADAPKHVEPHGRVAHV